MSTRKTLSVGQCLADHGRIAHFLRSTFGVEVISADTVREALQQMRQDAFDLVLVNRVFDLDGYSGIDFIRQVSADEQLRKVPIMLVSNFEDAQSRAVAAGAQPGFGKASLSDAETVEVLRKYL
jgi:two-component system chemotaxis response regulator CheY